MLEAEASLAEKRRKRAAHEAARCRPHHGCCLWHLAGKECFGAGHCGGAHLPKEERPPCAKFADHGRCRFKEEDCFFPHRYDVVEYPGINTVLQVSAPHRARFSAYVREHFQISTLHETRAHALTRNGDGALLLRAPDGMVATLAADPIVSLALRRAYVVDWCGRSWDTAVSEARRAVEGFAAACSHIAPRVRVQGYPPSLEDTLIDELSATAGTAMSSTDVMPLHVAPGRADALVSLVFVDGIYYVGVCPATDPRVAIGVMSTKQQVAADCGAVPLCRAYFKLWEAACRTGVIPVLHNAEVVATTVRTALDVGASPGGWSQYLAAVGFKVVAVDPGNVDTSLLSQGVEHLRMRGEAAISVLLDRGLARTFDAYTCDANVPTGVTASLFEATRPLLRPGAAVVISLKNFDGKRYVENRDAAWARIAASLQMAGDGAGQLLHLFNGGLEESTVIGVYAGVLPDANSLGPSVETSRE